MKLRSAALSNIGKVRLQNEDNFLCREELGLFGVADGVGGLPNGGEASECAVRTVARSVMDGCNSSGSLEQVVRSTNEAVLRLGKLLSPDSGIGTTLTVGHFTGTKVQLAHVGDSRCYLFRAGQLIHQTEDHTMENEARRRRALGEVIPTASHHPYTLTRCIGQPDALDIDLSEHEVLPGDRWLFVSDGVTGMVADAELAILLAQDTSPKECLEEIIKRALLHGGHDNATGVLVRVDATGG